MKTEIEVKTMVDRQPNKHRAEKCVNNIVLPVLDEATKRLKAHGHNCFIEKMDKTGIYSAAKDIEGLNLRVLPKNLTPVEGKSMNIPSISFFVSDDYQKVLVEEDTSFNKEFYDNLIDNLDNHGCSMGLEQVTKTVIEEKIYAFLEKVF